MKRIRRGYSFFSPFLLWSNLAIKATDMMVASAQVIGHRTGRMASAGVAPSVRDQREFVLMGHEKIEAGSQSMQAMASHMMTASQRSGVQALQTMLRTSAALMSLANSRTPAQMIKRQATLVRALRESAANLADASQYATRLAHRGLKPIHLKATANAKRLARR